MSLITVNGTNPVSVVVQKSGSPIAGSPFATAYDALAAAVAAADAGGGDTIKLLDNAGAPVNYDLSKAYDDHPVVTSQYWTLTYKYPDFAPGLGAGAVLNKYVMVDRPVRIQGTKSGSTYLTTIKPASGYACMGFMTHNNAYVEFDDLQFEKVGTAISCFNPSNVHDCKFTDCDQAVAHWFDDRLVFKNRGYDNKCDRRGRIVYSYITDNVFVNAGWNTCHIGSGTVIRGNTFEDTGIVDLNFIAGECIDTSCWFSEGSKVLFWWQEPSEGGDGLKLFEPVQGSGVPQANYFGEVEITNNQFINIGINTNEVIPTNRRNHVMWFGSIGFTDMFNIEISRNTMSFRDGMYSPIGIYNWPNMDIEALYEVAPWWLSALPPCNLEDLDVFNNVFSGAGKAAEACVLLAAYSRGKNKRCSLSCNDFGPNIADGAAGFKVYCSDATFEGWTWPQEPGVFGVQNHLTIQYNDFTDSAINPDLSAGVQLGLIDLGEITAPTKSKVYQPASTWPDPLLDPMEYMHDEDDNKFMGIKRKIMKHRRMNRCQMHSKRLKAHN